MAADFGEVRVCRPLRGPDFAPFRTKLLRAINLNSVAAAKPLWFAAELPHKCTHPNLLSFTHTHPYTLIQTFTLTDADGRLGGAAGEPASEPARGVRKGAGKKHGGPGQDGGGPCRRRRESALRARPGPGRRGRSSSGASGKRGGEPLASALLLSPQAAHSSPPSSQARGGQVHPLSSSAT